MDKRIASHKMKSISLEDLGTIVKQMINGTLEDTEQMSKLHRTICEELYFEKMTGFGDKTLEENLGKILPRKISKTELIQDNPNNDKLENLPKEQSICTHECKDFILSDQSDNYKVQEMVNKSAEISIIGHLKGSLTHIKKSEEITTSRATEKNKKILDENTLRNEQAYDMWKKEKMKGMRRMLKEERKKRQEESAAKQEEIERKRATYEAHLRSKKLVEMNRKVEETQRRAARDEYSTTEDQKNARIVANEEAFKAWIKRKNSRSSQRYSPSQRCRPQTASIKNCSEVIFDSWLDQLDSVLHQKYLRERRYLVRSFYCQPAYYGTAALCMQ